MTKQERFLNEFRANPSTIIKNNLLGLERYGVKAIGEGTGYDNTVFEEIYKLDIEYAKIVRKFVDKCRSRNIKFEDAYLEIGYDKLVLFNNSKIINGNFEYVIYLNNTSCVEDGIFRDEVILRQKSSINNGTFNGEVNLNDFSYINGGTFKNEVYLWDESHIENGVFDSPVSLHRGSYINNGVFNNEIKLSNRASIIKANFGNNCKVIMDVDWLTDDITLKLLKEKNVKIRYL